MFIAYYFFLVTHSFVPDGKAAYVVKHYLWTEKMKNRNQLLVIKPNCEKQ